MNFGRSQVLSRECYFWRFDIVHLQLSMQLIPMKIVVEESCS